MELRNQIPEKRESIIHAQNVFLSSPVNIFPNRETQKYVVGYEPKTYRIHYLTYKISKELINNAENSIKNNLAVDVNVREDFRWTIKKNDPNDNSIMKTVIFRIIPTRYNQLHAIYGMIFTFNWRKTGAGGVDEIQFKVSECPTIVNADTINDVCYKKIASQVSFGGTHGTHTYLLLSPQKGQYEIGKWVRATNVNWGGHRHVYVNPVTISL